MKALTLIILCSGLSFADQGANAFAEGFARALQARHEANYRQQQYEAQQAEQQREIPNTRQEVYFHPMTDGGRVSSMQFMRLGACESYVNSSGGLFTDCVRVQE